MKNLVLFVLIFISAVCFGQITTTKVAPRSEKIDVSPYDSTQNFLVGKDVYKYIGQELYLKGVSKSLRIYGYRGFTTDYMAYVEDPSNCGVIYKCDGQFSSKYEDMAEKYFTVLDVMAHPKAEINEHLYGQKYFFKLQEKESEDVLYYEYDERFEHSFPFILTGYYEYSKKLFMKMQFVSRGRNWIDESDKIYSINNGKEIDFSGGVVWRCVDLTIDEEYYSLSLLLEDKNGEKVAFSVDNVLKGNYFMYKKDDADKYKAKYGSAKWSDILKGKVAIGFTKEMCELSWGKPDDINNTITSGRKSEQWVYESNYLYFTNGILTAIQ
jgi:hypothetical protein